MTSAVDKQPAAAWRPKGRCGRLLTHSSYTTRRDTTLKGLGWMSRSFMQAADS